MTLEEWQAEAARLFGDDPMNWKFVCPSCGHVASVADWKAAGAPLSAAAFSCVGRWLSDADVVDAFKGGKPCNYAGGGLFRLNPVAIEGQDIGAFAFAPQQGDRCPKCPEILVRSNDDGVVFCPDCGCTA